MKLLFVTQVVDRNDAVLGAYHQWIIELAKRFERIEVICLYEGAHDLPANVRIHSLGKEYTQTPPGFLRRFTYAVRFKRLAWKLRHDYDAVLVHMNQEYVLIAGPMWKLLGKRVYLWRNHYAGSFFTDIAAALSTKVFCTSRFSYTAKYAKTVLMPVGVDTERFRSDPSIIRKPHSILFLARMTPSKDPLLLLEALRSLSEKGIPFTTTFVGSPLPEHEGYYRSLIERAGQYGLSDRVTFLSAMPNKNTPNIYNTHDIFVNTSRSGSFDKTIFEAAACGCMVLAASGDLREQAGEAFFYRTSDDLARQIESFATLASQERSILTDKINALANEHKLFRTVERLSEEMIGIS